MIWMLVSLFNRFWKWNAKSRPSDSVNIMQELNPYVNWPLMGLLYRFHLDVHGLQVRRASCISFYCKLKKWLFPFMSRWFSYSDVRYKTLLLRSYYAAYLRIYTAPCVTSTRIILTRTIACHYSFFIASLAEELYR